MSSHGNVGWSTRFGVAKYGDKQALADASGVSAFANAAITLVNVLGAPVHNTYTLADGSWTFWDVNAINDIYFAYTVGLGEDWQIVVTNPTAVVTQTHFASRASSSAHM